MCLCVYVCVCVSVCLHPAAIVALTHSPNTCVSQILYTGDYSREEDRHLHAAEMPDVQPDVLIIGVCAAYMCVCEFVCTCVCVCVCLFVCCDTLCVGACITCVNVLMIPCVCLCVFRVDVRRAAPPPPRGARETVRTPHTTPHHTKHSLRITHTR